MRVETAAGRNRLVPWIIYLLFFAVLNETVFNVSTPMIASQFSLTPAGVSWMMTVFMVFFGIGSVIYGKLSDIYSIRRLIIIGIVIYDAGSVLGFALRASYPLVIAARAVQGIGASALPALIFVVVARYFAASERGKVFGFLTSTVSVAVGVGPVVGGFISGKLHWSFLFLIPLLLLVTIPFFSRELPAQPRREGRVDILGGVLVALTVGALVVYLNLGDWYWLAIFAAALVLLLVRIFTASDPFIKPSLFANARFRSGVIVGFCLFSIVIGVFFIIPLMLNDLYGLDPSRIGLLLFPGAISSVVVGPIGGTLADRRGNSFVVSLGLGLLVASLVLLYFLLGVSAAFVALALLLTYVGFALFQTAIVNSVSQTLPDHETGVGMGIFNLVSIISGAVGTALVGKSLAGRWLDFPLLRPGSPREGDQYSNLMVAFVLVVILGGIVYLRSFRGMAKVPSLKRAVDSGSSRSS